MSKLYSLGELLIDFQSVGFGGLKETREFVKNAGGAPANVCVQAVKLGQQAVYLTKVGDDGFGDFLIETLKNEGVDTKFISKSKDYDTSLAFVSFKEGGEREFSFYRRTAADLYFLPEDFKGVCFEKGDIFEFGSVALKTKQAKETHKYLINKANENNCIICFDPNLRLNLWENAEELKHVVNEFAEYAHVIKVGVDELEFITGLKVEDAIKSMFKGKLQILLVTDGDKGAKLYLSDGRVFGFNGYKVNCIDTTGAGDSFFGGFVAQVLEQKMQVNELVNNTTNYLQLLDFACKCGAYTTTGYGAIKSMGNKEIINKAVK